MFLKVTTPPILRLSACAVAVVSLAGAQTSPPANGQNPEPQAAAQTTEPGIEELITRLGDDSYRAREEASHLLWKRGKSAVSALEKALNEGGPEVRARAADLLRMVRLHIGPDTDPKISKLVEHYLASSRRGDKIRDFKQLYALHAWRQMLLLYEDETDSIMRKQLAKHVEKAAVTGARELLEMSRHEDALELLQLDIDESRRFANLAAYHRQMGTLDGELAKLEGADKPQDLRWKLALLAAQGDWSAAAETAGRLGDRERAAIFLALGGDPMPWLSNHRWRRSYGKSYATIAKSMWQGKSATREQLAKLREQAGSESRTAFLLALLGRGQEADEILGEQYSYMMAAHFLDVERVDQALALMDIDPQKLVDAAWARARLKHVDLYQTEEEDTDNELNHFVLMANFLESRGLSETLWEAYAQPLLEKSREKDGEEFFLRLLELMDRTKSSRFVNRIAAEWAGDDAARWTKLIETLVSNDDDTRALRAWMRQLDPQPPEAEFLALSALNGRDVADVALYPQWLDRLWKSVESSQGHDLAQRRALMFHIGLACADADVRLRAYGLLSPDERVAGFDENYWRVLAQAQRWQEAATLSLRALDARKDAPPQIRLGWRAIAAAALRRAGKDAEAATQDRIAGLMALGDPLACNQLAQAYRMVGDRERMHQWLRNAICNVDKDGLLGGLEGEEDYRPSTLDGYALSLLRRGEWRHAASCLELYCGLAADRVFNAGGSSQDARIWRMRADTARGIDLHAADRQASDAVLARACEGLDGYGSLADDFFPSLRKAGLMEQNARHFAPSWTIMSALCARYPGAHNTLNTAAWLASRASLHLDEALSMSRRSLENRPRQSAYLDTMAEVLFASSKRREAMEYSQRAVMNHPILAIPDIIDQREHYRQDPVPGLGN